jgi:hypothetical protein
MNKLAAQLFSTCITLASIVAASAAWAQGSPGLIPGQVMTDGFGRLTNSTAAQWNGYFSTKQNFPVPLATTLQPGTVIPDGTTIGLVGGKIAVIALPANLPTSIPNGSIIPSPTLSGTVLGTYTLGGTPTITGLVSINKVAITAPATNATLTIANGKVLVVNNSLTFAGVDGTTMTFPSTSKTIAANDLSNVTVSGDCTNASAAFTCNKTGGVSFATVATSGSATDLTTGTLPAARLSLAPITAALGADVALNNIANYFDGPSIAQGSTGTWWACGTVSLNGNANDGMNIKLWDGTTLINSTFTQIYATGGNISASLCGFISSPAGNIRISVRDVNSTAGSIKFNSSGNSKDSNISAHRIN